MRRTSRSSISSAAAVMTEAPLHETLESAAKQDQQRKKKLLPKPQKLPDLDRIIHEHVRLGIVSALAANDSVTFSDLKNLLNTTDGNLSVHARKLEDAGYVECTKSFEGRLPKTEYRLTSAGRKALTDYLNHLETLIRVARGRRAG